MQKIWIFCKGHADLDALVSYNLKQLMRITAVGFMIMVFAGNMLLASPGRGQTKASEKRIDFEIADKPLSDAFRLIEERANVVIMYELTLKNVKEKVTLSVTDKPVGEVLDLLTKGKDLMWNYNNNVFRIYRTSDPSSITEGLNPRLITPSLDPPPITIRGRIVNENGEPVVASITIKGTTRGVTSNADGTFEMYGVDEDAVLVVSATNIEMREVKVNSRLNVGTVAVVIKASNLDELQVIAYGTTTKRFQTGNVSTLKSSEIEKQPVQNPLLALQGRVPGLVVTQMTGMNGGAVQIRIQGQNSFGSGLEPLIVIDGVPYPSQSDYVGIQEYVTGGGSPLNYISPSHIESISVLKDADATAIYGSRASNGAILITTKKGKAGKPKLSIDVQQGWGKVTRRVDMMNTRQYLDMRYEAYKNDGIDLATQTIGSSNFDLKFWDTTRHTNWQKELIGGTAQYSNINTGFSGGTANVQYLVGASFSRQSTVFPGNFDNKVGGLHFSLNSSSSNQRLRIQLSGSYQYNQNGLPGSDLTQRAITLEPNAPKLYNDDGSLNWAPNASGRSTWTNPLVNSLYTEFSNTTKNLISSMNIGYTILPGLALSSNFGYNSLQTDLFQGTKLAFNRPENRPFTQRSANFGRRNIHSWIIEPQLQLERNIGKGRLDALVGATVQKSALNFLYVQASGQPTDELLHSLAAATSISAGASGNDLDRATRFNGLFGRIGYNWDKKYLINLTGRRDGSSKFGAENRFHIFWSAGAGWIFSEENWFKPVLPFLSFGKLRVSYGTTGNDQIKDYSYLSLYNIVTTDILYQGTTSLDVTGLSNPLLQWEETRKLQGGIDLAAFGERIALAVTFARNRSSNQLIYYSLPNLTGFTGITKNFPATIQNTSWEFAINTVNIKSKNVSWSTNFNLTIPHNKVVNFPGIELTSFANGLNGVIIGDPIGIMKKYQYGGVDPLTGNYYPLDKNGKPVYLPSFPDFILDQTAKVSLLPKYYGGMSNTISYRGFQLDFLFQFVYQMGPKDLYYFNGLINPGRFSSGNSNQPARIVSKQWQKPGDVASVARFSTRSLTIWPNSSSTDEGFGYAAGSYIRLKNVSFSWQLPDAWSKKARFQTARIYFRGQNLATITGHEGLDAETGSISTLPPLQMWTVGAKIEL